MCTGIRLLLLIHPFISSVFFLSNFQTLKIFVALFSETVRPIKLTLDTHVDNGWMYRVYRNQAAASYLSLISFSPVFKNFKFSLHFSQKLWGQNSLNLVHLLTVVDVSWIPESGCCHLFVLLFRHFSFSPVIKHLQFLSHFSQELWGLESWHLVHMWTMGECIVYTGIRLLLLICRFIVHFSFSPIFCYKFVFLLW